MTKFNSAIVLASSVYAAEETESISNLGFQCKSWDRDQQHCGVTNPNCKYVQSQNRCILKNNNAFACHGKAQDECKHIQNCQWHQHECQYSGGSGPQPDPQPHHPSFHGCNQLEKSDCIVQQQLQKCYWMAGTYGDWSGTCTNWQNNKNKTSCDTLDYYTCLNKRKCQWIGEQNDPQNGECGLTCVGNDLSEDKCNSINGCTYGWYKGAMQCHAKGSHDTGVSCEAGDDTTCADAFPQYPYLSSKTKCICKGKTTVFGQKNCECQLNVCKNNGDCQGVNNGSNRCVKDDESWAYGTCAHSFNAGNPTSHSIIV